MKKILLVSLLALTLCGCKEKTYTPIEICYAECCYHQKYENEKNIPYSYKEITFKNEGNYKHQWAYEITLYLDEKIDVWFCWLVTNADHLLEAKPTSLSESELVYPTTDIDCDFIYSITYEVEL